MAPAQTIVVGQLAGAFGVKGWLKVRSFTQPEDNILSYQPWWLKTESGIRSVEILDYKFRPQGLVVQLKGIDDRDVAVQLGRSQIVVAQDLLPDLEQGEFYHHQLLGLKVYVSAEDSELLLGTVASVMETGANDVIIVKPSKDSIDDNERLIPFVVDQYILRVDLASGRLWADWDPEF